MMGRGLVVPRWLLVLFISKVPAQSITLSLEQQAGREKAACFRQNKLRSTLPYRSVNHTIIIPF